MKKKILFITSHYYPSQSIAEIRSSNIVKHLHDNNFDVTVLTLKEEYYFNKNNEPDELVNVKKIRVKYFFRLGAGNIIKNALIPNVIQKITLKILPFFGFDFLSFWQNNAIKEVLMNKDNYDFILATGPPFSNFSLAKRLAKKLNSKYILDYRDLWSLSPHNIFMKNRFNTAKEKRIVEKASLVTFVSNSMKIAMHKKFSINNSIILTNGYNKKTFDLVENIFFKKFIISYTGHFYLPKRVIDPLFQAFKVLKNENNLIYSNIKFIYCGNNGKYVQEKSEEYDVVEVVENKFSVSRNEAFSITKSSDLSLVITSVFEDGSLSDKSIITGKIFEALGMNTVILCISPVGSDVRRIISNEKRGYNFTGKNIRNIANVIKKEFENQSNQKNEFDNSEFEWSNIIKAFVYSIKNVNF